MSDQGRRYKLSTSAVLQLYRQLGHHVRPHRTLMLAAALCMMGATAAELLRPWPLKFIFDGILVPQHSSGWLVQSVMALTGTQDMLLIMMIAMILGVAVLGAAFGLGQSYLMSLVGQRVVTSIRIALFRQIQRLSLSFHDQRSTGDLMTRLTQDAQMMREFLVNSGMLMLARSMLVACSLAVMVWMDWRLAVAAASVVPALLFVTWWYGKKIKMASRSLRKREGQLANIMNESIAAIKVVQAYAREAFEEERFADRTEAGTTATMKATRLEANMERTVQIILALGTCAVIGYGVLRVRAGVLTPGDLLVFSAYLTGLYKPIRKLSSITGRMSKATVSGERIVDILKLTPDIVDAPDSFAAPPLQGSIAFRNVSFGYRESSPILSNASFGIEAGESVAIMSRSGSGKSTISNLMLRFYDPLSGSICIDGVDVKKFTIDSVRQQIAVVLQDAALFNATVRDNILYGKLEAGEMDVVRAAAAAGAHEFIMSLPEGYDTVVGERGALLSGGQRQRILLARAFIRDARILIFDEPLVGLDSESEMHVRRAMQTLMRARTTIIITHDPDVARMADRVLTISRGRVYEIEPNGVMRIGPAQ
jgi:ATP-binding cassette, subfamily B, bacterial